MVVQASGARRLAERDPARAGDAFLAVEQSGREALTEIRGLLGVLRREDEELALAPQPSLRHLATLVRKAQAAGLPVELEVEGDARDLPIGVDLTGYRVVQEALGGALEPGQAGRARVRVRYENDFVELEVTDDGGVDARPLPGIRERVDAFRRPAARRRPPRRRPRRARPAPARRLGMRRWIARARRLDRRRIDQALAAVLVVAGEIELAVQWQGDQALLLNARRAGRSPTARSPGAGRARCPPPP